MTRDKKAQAELKNLGWDLFVIWQCEMKDLENLKLNLKRFIEGDEKTEHE